MSKARNLADLLGSDGDVKSSRLDSHGAKKDFSNVGTLPTAVRNQLKGDIGNTGPQGSQGPTGATGAQGPAGSDGTIGSNGADGATGATGPQGATGATGAQGATGPAGSPDTSAQVLTKIKAVDGSGSDLDADLLDGQHASAFATSNHSHSYLPLSGGTLTGDLIIDASNVGIGGSPVSPLHLKYSSGSYSNDSSSGFINEASTGRATMRLRSITDNAAELFFDIDGAIRWDVSVRNSSSSYAMNWYPAASTPAYNGVSAHVMQLSQDGDLYVANSITVGSNTVWHAGNDGSGSGLDADLLDGQQASAFATSSHSHSGLTTSGAAHTFTTQYGNIQLGPMNSSHAHIYTNLSNFYFNRTALYAAGNTIWHAGNDGSGSGLDADLLDGQHASAFATSGHKHAALHLGGNSNPSLTLESSNELQFRDASGNYSTLHVNYKGGNTYVSGTNLLVPRTGNITRGGNTVWDAGTDGSGSGLDADLLDGRHGSSFLPGTDLREITGLGTSGAQAQRHHVMRLYGCANHWNSDWQNMRLCIHEETYDSGYLEYSLFGQYGDGSTNMMQLRLKDVRGGGDVGRYKVVLGSPVSAGWDYSGQPTHYVDVYVDVAYYKSVNISIHSYGHGFLSSNPASGTACSTVVYSSPAVTNISDFNENHDTSYFHNHKIWNDSNDGSGSGLDADLLDGQHASDFYSASNPPPAAAPTVSGTAPSSPSEGDLWMDTTTHGLKVYDGTRWVLLNNLYNATGGVKTTSGSYTYHTFTSSGTFVSEGEIAYQYLLVAGGGGGGARHGGGGGAGGYITGTGTLTAQSYTIVIGGGGGGAVKNSSNATSGANSSFNGITATGGGRGGQYSNNSGHYSNGASGGSGGGGASVAGLNINGNGTGGSGTSGQGNSGGSSSYGSNWSGAGGGGKGAAAANLTSSNYGTSGGVGAAWLNGIYYSGGGGGGGNSGAGAGGNGGGGAGAKDGASATAGTANRGGGGGGRRDSTNTASSNGGSGVVIIRYITP